MNTSTAAIRVANAPCSWGVLEFDLPGKALGYAQVLDEIRATGYEGTELGDWGFMPTDPGELRNQLKTRGLMLLGAFVPVAFAREEAHDEGIERAVRTAQLMAGAAGTTPFLVLADENGKDPARTERAGRIRTEDSLSPSQWETFGRGVNRVAEAVKMRAGLRTVFHHHCAGFVEAPWEIEALLQATDPKLVGLCFDTGHYRFGGGNDPVEALSRHWDRIWYVHFKDCSPAQRVQAREQGWDYFTSLKNGIFCELGKGDIDFATVSSTLRSKGYQGWIVVEQDVLPGMGEPKEFARRNREFLKGLGL